MLMGRTPLDPELRFAPGPARGQPGTVGSLGRAWVAPWHLRVGGARSRCRRSGPGRAHGRCVAFTRAVPFALRPQTMAGVASPLWSPRNGDPGRSRPQSARAAPSASCHSLLGPQRSFLNLTQALRLLLKAPSDRVCKEAVSFWARVRRGVGANQVDGSLPPAWQGHMPRQQHPLPTRWSPALVDV